jgi:alkanesulfonate monooxygenase SsuD/methylene tetrahydromethanopterin reductase-like flavin-dependent oxidoreductase (luciferase family)
MFCAVYAPPFGTFGDVTLLVELAQRAEQAGWDGFFLWDHLLYENDVPFVDAWIALAAIAASTERIRLGPLVTPLPRRRPWKVARESVTLDHLSAGRLVLGVGLGIDHWREFAGFGGEAADDRARADLLDDGIEIIDRLWTGEPVTYRGRRLAVDDVRFLPAPRQAPRIPIWSAVLWPPRPGPLRRAARWDGVVPFRPDRPMTPENARELHAAVQNLRAPDQGAFEMCLHGRQELAADFAEAGVTWFMESCYPEQPLTEVRRIIGDGPPRV